MKVFLTGGSGYIGSAVALALKKAGHDVLALVRSEAKGGARGGIPSMFFGTALKHGAAHTVGSGENHWPMVHVDDLAELYVRLVERAPAGSVYYAADASRFTQREIAEAASRAAGKDGKLQPQQPDGTPYQEALTLDQQISSEKARNDLDWRPRHESFVGEAAH